MRLLFAVLSGFCLLVALSPDAGAQFARPQTGGSANADQDAAPLLPPPERYMLEVETTQDGRTVQRSRVLAMPGVQRMDIASGADYRTVLIHDARAGLIYELNSSTDGVFTTPVEGPAQVPGALMADANLLESAVNEGRSRSGGISGTRYRIDMGEGAALFVWVDRRGNWLRQEFHLADPDGLIIEAAELVQGRGASVTEADFRLPRGAEVMPMSMAEDYLREQAEDAGLDVPDDLSELGENPVRGNPGLGAAMPEMDMLSPRARRDLNRR